MEFYYGYCLFNCAMFSESDTQKCVERATRDPKLNPWTHSTCVSCWVNQIRDGAAMWNVHGHAGAAVRITVNNDNFCEHVRQHGYRLASGRVTSEGMTSMVSPQFLTRWELTDAADSVHHFFFHKRASLEWEQEYRLIVQASGPVCIPLRDEIIESVVVRRLQSLTPTSRN
ncbi:MAG: hypothetical protein DME32_05540 [Verrucomicrobia bacterium]|nr:MAG: hypothetical protein DME32_05540 [Verrucomicrobiota bacterium]